MSLFNFINPLKERKSMAGMPLLSSEEFKAIMRHECARCDRNSHEFSLILIDFDHFNGNGKRNVNHSIRSIIKRMRMTDELGCFDEKRLGIFLPETSFEGAKTFMGDICSENYCKIYTYPSALPYEIDKGNGTGRGNVNDKDHSDRGLGQNREVNTPHEGSSVDTSFGSDIKTFIHHHEKDETLEELLLEKKFPVWKRVIDIAGASIGLIILLPLFAVVSIYIKLVSTGPVFFKQERIGYLGRSFTMWKFRTMKTDTDPKIHQEHLKDLMSSDTALTKLDQGKDERLLPLAGIMRKTTIDELPQLFNVLKGDMSLVGPRPCLSYEAKDFALWQNQRFHAYPGMTGLWQVSGKNRTTFKEMMRLDIRYAQNKNILLDLFIFIKTVPVVIGLAAEKWVRQTVRSPSRRSPGPASGSSWNRNIGDLVRNLFL